MKTGGESVLSHTPFPTGTSRDLAPVKGKTCALMKVAGPLHYQHTSLTSFIRTNRKQIVPKNQLPTTISPSTISTLLPHFTHIFLLTNSEITTEKKEFQNFPSASEKPHLDAIRPTILSSLPLLKILQVLIYLGSYRQAVFGPKRKGV